MNLNVVGDENQLKKKFQDLSWKKRIMEEDSATYMGISKESFNQKCI